MSAPAIGRRAQWAPGPNAKVDWSHPLAQGLTHCQLGSVELVTGRQVTITGNATIENGIKSPGTGSQSGSSIRGRVPAEYAATTPFSILCYATTGAYVDLASWWGIGTTNTPAAGFGAKRGFLSYQNNIYFWGIIADVGTSVAFPTDGKPHLVGVVASSSEVFGVVDSNIGTGVTRPAALVDLDDGYVVALGHHSAGNSPNGIFHIGFAFARQLDTREVAELYADPFCMLTY